MNIGAATFMGYAYTNTNTKTTASKQRDTNNETTFPTQAKKEYKNAVKEFTQRHPDYEAWVLGYTVENRSVKFPFQTSNLCIEKFGASIEEHRGEGIPMNTTGNTKKTEKPEESWWYKRHKRMKELIKEQEEEAFSKNNVQKCVHCAKQLTLSYYK